MDSCAPFLATSSHIQQFGLLKEKEPWRGTSWDLLASWASFLVCKHHILRSVVNTVKGFREGVGSPFILKAQLDKALGNLIQH